LAKIERRPGEFKVVRADTGYCALGVHGDTYRNCAGDCLYCYEKQCNNQHLRKPKIVPLDHRSLFNSLYDDPDVHFWRTKKDLPLRIGAVADPFTPVEKRLRSTARLLKLLAQVDVQIQLTTKRPDIVDDKHIEILKRFPKAMIRVSFGTTSDQVAADLEPGSPPPSERFEHIRRLSEAGIEMGVRFSPYFYTFDYDYQKAADCGATNATVEAFRFSALWRHSTPPKLWEVLSGQEFPGGDVTKKDSFARQWVEAREKEFFGPLQNLDAHAYLAPGNLWIYTDPFKWREIWTAEREKAHLAGLQWGICGFGCGIHNIDLNDAPCGCLTEGWKYDEGALVPSWHRNQWADYIMPKVFEYHRDLAIMRFAVANSEWNRPIALDDSPDLNRAGVLDVEEMDDIGSDRALT